MVAPNASLRRRQIDRIIANPLLLRSLSRPARGWIREVRELLGMRAAQVAARLGVSGAAVLQLERSEAEGTISLNSLERVAGALGCRVVYAFAPEASSFDEMLRLRANLVAAGLVGGVSHSMALEDQQTASEEQNATIEELTAELMRKLPRELWDEPV